MSRFSHRRLTALLGGVALAASAVGASSVAQAAYEDATMSIPRETSGTPGLGPHFPYVQVIFINKVVPLVDQAIVNRTKNGYLFRAGQHSSDLTVTESDGRLRFVDTRTPSWKWLPDACQRLDVPQGIGASCRIPTRFSLSEPMLVEIWPRLGNDVIDTSALSAEFDVSFLGDKGDDVAHLGAGDDFVNGAQESDRIYGGDGRDWIRTGENNDFIDGGPGDDYLVGVLANDTVHGGSGNDTIYGSDGNDELFAGEGRDHLGCGPGADSATFKSTDRAVDCENRNVS